MFSWILEFISVVKAVEKKIQDEKTKRIKRRTKDEALKESDSIAEAHENTKNSENVVEAEKKSKKLKGQKILIDVLKFVAELFEVSIIGTLIFIGILIFFVALVVILIMFILYGFLTNAGIIPEGGIYTPNEECIQGTQAVQSTGYDLSSMNQLSGTMTEHQKNLMRFLALYQDYLSRDDVWADPQYVDEIKSILGEDNLFNFMHGFSFCETGGYFTVQYNYSKDKNILEYSTTHNAAYCFLGLKKGDKFDKYYGGYGSAMSTDSFVDYVKNKYVPKDYQVTDNNYAPYGAATQLSLVGTESLRPYNDDVETLLPTLMDAYGIQENRDELMAYCKLFMAAAYYHSHFSGTEDLLSIWCAIWSATSDVDANRGFDNIKIVYDELYLGEKMYGEPTGRQFIFGTGGSNNLVVKWDQTCDTYFQINGKDLNVTLWTWVRDNCSNNTEFMRAANAYLIAKGGTEEVNNAHYGLFAYLITPKIVSDLGGTVPVVTGGSIDECDCYDGGSYGSVDLSNRDFSNVVVGEPQGIYPDDVVQKLKSLKKYQPYYGRFDSLSDPNAKLHWTGTMTREEWRLKTKWKVPYEYQAGGDSWQSAYRYPHGKGNACPMYAQSYVYSAMTGRAVNVQEIMAAEWVYFNGGTGSENSSGNYVVRRQEFCEMAKDAGFYVRYMTWSGGKGTDQYVTEGAKDNAPILYPTGSIKEQIDYVLENNGIVVVHVVKGDFKNSEHHFPIIQKTGENTYLTHDAAHKSKTLHPTGVWLDLMEHSLEDIIGKNGSYLSGNGGNVMFAWNPSLDKSSGGSANINMAADAEGRAKQMWDYLIQNGFSEEATAGIIGNSAIESGYTFDPSVIQGNGKGPAAGLFQWENYNTKSARWASLNTYAQGKGKSWDDFGIQMEFMLSELSGCLDGYSVKNCGEKIDLGMFKSYKDVARATEVFMLTFERPGKPHLSGRITEAEKYYNMFKGQAGSANFGSNVKFENFLFVGDSYTVGLKPEAEGAGHIVRASVGATCAQWVGVTTTTKTMGLLNDSITLSDIDSSSINGVVVLLGANSPTQDDKMIEFLNELKTKYSNIPIFVQKTFPMGKNHRYASSHTSNIATFNTDIETFCKSNGFYYIDTTTNLVGSDGYLLHPDKEGIHLTRSEGDYGVWWSNIETEINKILGTLVGSSSNGSVNCIPKGGSASSTINGPSAGMTNAKQTKEERWKFILGADYVDNWFTSESRQKDPKWSTYIEPTNMKDKLEVITVKAWDLDSNGKWVSYDFEMLVNKALSSSFIAIFNDLYNLPENERLPIHNSVSQTSNVYEGFDYRHNSDCFVAGYRGGGSVHNIGAAIDINIAENPMPGQCGVLSDYKPDIDPYSIKDNAKIVEIFSKYGFYWGGKWSTTPDYMHFTYLESINANIQDNSN